MRIKEDLGHILYCTYKGLMYFRYCMLLYRYFYMYKCIDSGCLSLWFGVS